MPFSLHSLAHLVLVAAGCLLPLPQAARAAPPIALAAPIAVSALVADPRRRLDVPGADAGEPAFLMPLDSFRLSSPFGPRRHPIRGRAHTHSGADMAAPRGTPVRVVAAGTVVAVRDLAVGYGRHVVVEHTDGFSSWYAHLDSVDSDVGVGSELMAGQQLGAVGSSGSATGPHLHLEIRCGDVPMEPMALLRDAAQTTPAAVGVAPPWRANAAPP